MTNSRWTRARLTVGLVAFGLTATACGNSVVADLLDAGVPVFEANRTAPDTVELALGACNPTNLEVRVEQTEPDTYEVRAIAEGATQDDCGSIVEIDVDPALDTVTVIDRRSGETFTLLGSGEAAPLGLNGTWRMVTVAMGEPVVVGRTTAEIPEITIEADETSGVISGNFGCNVQSIEVVFSGEDTLAGLPETLEGEQELCTIPDGGDQLVLTERTLLDLLSGEPVELFLRGDQVEIGNFDTNAVFERIAG